MNNNMFEPLGNEIRNFRFVISHIVRNKVEFSIRHNVQMEVDKYFIPFSEYDILDVHHDLIMELD